MQHFSVSGRDLRLLLAHPEVVRAEREKWIRTRRPKQRPPPGDWRVWCLHTGRGWGKTRTASEGVREIGVEAGVADVLAIGPTATDVHDVMVPMLLKVLGPEAEYRRSIEAPSIRAGSTTIHLRSGQRIDRCRGLGVGLVWCDEIDSWKPEGITPREAWLSVVEPTCREAPAKLIVTSTPKRGGLVSWLVQRPDVVVVTGHSQENASHLAAGAIDSISAAYAGSWLERQELGGEIVADIEGALVTRDMIEASRVVEVPEPLDRIVVGLDPSGGGDAQGIIGVGRGQASKHLYVLADRTCNLKPDGWGRRTLDLLAQLDGDRIVAERNYGGDMVESTLRTIDRIAPIRMVTATRGKHVRFEPVAALYAQGRLHHVGRLAELEDEVTMFNADGYEGTESPNRADALVWACMDLCERKGVSATDLYGAGGFLA